MKRVLLLLVAVALVRKQRTAAFRPTVAFISPFRQPPRLYRSYYMLDPSSSSAAESTTEETVVSSLRELYPRLPPLANGTLQVDDIHRLYYEEHGQPSNNSSNDNVVLHALFLHGGPGAGCFANHARFFDPNVYHVVLLDQRGSGRSTPPGEIRQNTLLKLVEDCERLRQHLGIARWDVVLGGSWGSTLAVAYAQSFPANVGSIVLRAVCLMRSCEVDWVFSNRGGAVRIDPGGWQRFAEAVNSTERTPREALHGYYDHLLSNDPVRRLEAARCWMAWEFSLFSSSQTDDDQKSCAPVAVRESSGWSFQDGHGELASPITMKELGIVDSCEDYVNTLRQGLLSVDKETRLPTLHMRPIRPVPGPASSNTTSEPAFIPAQNMLTCFYSVNDGYALDNLELLHPDRMAKIQHIPCVAVHGGLDRICPVDTALDLQSHWPTMELRIPTMSGHSMYDVGMVHEVVCATDRLAFFCKSRRMDDTLTCDSNESQDRSLRED